MATTTVKHEPDQALQLNALRDALALINQIHAMAEAMQGERHSEPLERLSRMAGDKVFAAIDDIAVDSEAAHG